MLREFFHNFLPKKITKMYRKFYDLLLEKNCPRFQANLCSLRSQCWQYETIQSDFEPLWSWQEKNSLFSALLLLVINRWCHKRKERLWEAWKIFLFTWVIFPVFVPTSAKKANVGKNCYANFQAMPIVWQKGGRRIRWEKKSKSSSPFENWREQHEICSSFASQKRWWLWRCHQHCHPGCFRSAKNRETLF